MNFHYVAQYSSEGWKEFDIIDEHLYEFCIVKSKVYNQQYPDYDEEEWDNE